MLSKSSSRSTSKSLHPKVQAALSCLDLRLEDELMRYRRQRAGFSVAPIVMRPKKKKKELDLMSFGSESETQSFRASQSQSQVSSDVPPKAVSFDVSRNDVSPDLEAPTPDLAMIPFEPESAGDALLHIANGTTEQADEYLESSEHLLKSLEREEAKVRVERSFLENLATPLGIGSMLTLLVSSAMFGYVIMNPSVLAGMGRWFEQKEETTMSPAGNAEGTLPQDAPSADIPNSPPLDAQEFVDLGLNNFAIVQSTPAIVPSPVTSPSPSVSPSPAATQSPESNAQPGGAAALMAPTAKPATNSSPQVARSVPANPPAPQPAPNSSVLLPSVPVARTNTPAASNPAPVQRGSLGYKIEMPFTGDQSLETARQAVPDAFLRSDGKIQLGATNTQAEAQQKLQDLRNRGITAEVRQR